MTEERNHERRFDVAFSFPGEHRRFVRKVATHVASSLSKERVFFDEWYEAELAGKNGDLKLVDVYLRDSELVVPFFSKYYHKTWCKLEWDAIRGMLLTRKEGEVAPVRLDDTEIPGWLPNDFHIPRRGRSAKVLAALIIEKVTGQPPPQTKSDWRRLLPFTLALIVPLVALALSVVNSNDGSPPIFGVKPEEQQTAPSLASETASMSTGRNNLKGSLRDPLRVSSLEVDDDLCNYVLHDYDPSVPIFDPRVTRRAVAGKMRIESTASVGWMIAAPFPRGEFPEHKQRLFIRQLGLLPLVAEDLRDDQLTVTAFGQVFADDDSFAVFSEQYAAATNCQLFLFLTPLQLSASDVPIAIDYPEGKRLDAPEDPTLVVSVTNDSRQQEILSGISFVVDNSIGLLGRGKTRVLDPLASIPIDVSSRPGEYAKTIVPPIKIAKNDSAAVRTTLTCGASKADKTANAVVGRLVFHFEDHEVATPRFIIVLFE